MDVEALLDSEEAKSRELCVQIARLTDEELRRSGITPDGWSVKDVLFHIGLGAWPRCLPGPGVPRH